MVWDCLGTLDGKDATLLSLDIKKLVVPVNARNKILQILHYSHQGITKTYAAARIYIRNHSWIKPSESSLNEIHQAKNLRVKCDKSTYHCIKEGNMSSTKIEIPTGCLCSKNSEPPSKRIKFDQTMILARCELKCWRLSPT